MEHKFKYSTFATLYAALMVKLIKEVEENTEAGNVDDYFIPYPLASKVGNLLTDSVSENAVILTKLMVSVFEDNVYRHTLTGQPCAYIALNTSIATGQVLNRIEYLITKLTTGEYNPTLHELLSCYGGLLTPLATGILSDEFPLDDVVTKWKPLEEHQTTWNEAGLSHRPCCVSHDVSTSVGVDYIHMAKATGEHNVQSDLGYSKGW